MYQTRRQFLASLAGAAAVLQAPWYCYGAAGEPSQLDRISEAIPNKAPAKPTKPRRLLIFDLNVGYGGHGSIPTANLAFKMMGEKTGAFETVVSKDASVFEPKSLSRFDAVFFNNNVGNLFTDPALRRSLLEFVYGGGGLMGVHGTSVAFTKWPGAIEDWPEFGIMLGARGANHRESTEHVHIKLDDPSHPVNASFGGKGFEYRDEHFRFHQAYSRRRARVLMSIDTEKTDLAKGPEFGNVTRPDNDYALAWVRRYGRGRVFYCTIAHNPYVFWDPKMLEFYLAATQFALGDLPAPATPSALLTPAVRAQEKLGWRLGLESSDRRVFPSIEEAAKFSLLYIGCCSDQTVSGPISAKFDARLNPDQMKQIRLKLDEHAVNLAVYRVDSVPTDPAKCRKLFEFARIMGTEVITGQPDPGQMDAIEKLCDEFDIKFAVSNLDKPADAIKLCKDRSERIGVHGDLLAWRLAELDPLDTIRTIGHRLTVLQLDDLSGAGHRSKTIPALLAEILSIGAKPAMFTLASRPDLPDSHDPMGWTAELFNNTCIKLAN